MQQIGEISKLYGIICILVSKVIYIIIIRFVVQMNVHLITIIFESQHNLNQN